MIQIRRNRPLRLLGLVVLVWLSTRSAVAQFGPLAVGSQFDLADTVQLDRADSTTLAHLERFKACLADRQWDEAIETLRQLTENSEGKLLGVTERRWIGLADYCQMQLAALPPQALKLYRSRVDPVAEKWYEEGIARRDRRLLGLVVQKAFASSWGDKALLALGEIALESGQYGAARRAWQRILPAEPPPGAAQSWPGFPDTHLDLATVRARLVLVSILEGDAARAREELAQMVRLYPNSRGRLGGREVNFVAALGELLAQSAAWPVAKSSPDWPTFAGAPARNKQAARMVDAARVAWHVPLPRLVELSKNQLHAGAAAADPAALLAYHPLVVGKRVLVNNRREILALKATDGKPAWGSTEAIYREPLEEAAALAGDPAEALGMARFTMTAYRGRLYARMGSAVTSRPQQPVATTGNGYLVCLDLEAEGRLVWKSTAEEGWAYEGSPLADGTNVYVAMRRNDIRPQAYVACLDAQSGRLRWRRFICGAESPARGMLFQLSHNLLTLDEDILYYNTNLGAVAALSAEDGRLLWLSLYPRERRGDLLHLAAHWNRDLNPCLMDHGTLLVAPADSPRIFAFDAGTGQILWQSETQLDDVLHLLGVSGNQLIAAGQRLYWIGLRDEHRGQIEHVWPDGAEKLGYGRGLLAGDCVLWPTRQKIFALDQKTAQPRKAIDLAPLGITGGNLLVADGRLLIATDNELIALGQGGESRTPDEVASVSLPLPRVACDAMGEGRGEGGERYSALTLTLSRMEREPYKTLVPKSPIPNP
jgi:outer membrane protein assembly factor BamB